ncbi:MAG: low-specificity L-threonine aldolase [Pseudomonadales bacterium]|nr:low-specificity L-threonine aldolase [Pseudomonadales bacterium]
MSVIDLRSDTLTRPTEPMLEAMMRAETGDDVYGEDPTVNELEAYSAKITGKAAALYTTSGTQSNLLALLSHCQRGDEYIAGQDAHSYQFEGGGAAVLGGIQPYTLQFNERGELPLEALKQAVKPDDFHYAITRLVCLENTQAGKVLGLTYLNLFAQMMANLNLKSHLDGARVFNAAIAQKVPVATLCNPFDTISICLSKGLGCPVGSILVGDEETIHRARRLRKMLGGGMRQAGIIAASGLYALRNNINKLAQDHEKAKKVYDKSTEFKSLSFAAAPETNMLFLAQKVDADVLNLYLAKHGIKVSGRRWVFHLDISDADVDYLLDICSQFDRLVDPLI